MDLELQKFNSNCYSIRYFSILSLVVIVDGSDIIENDIDTQRNTDKHL